MNLYLPLVIKIKIFLQRILGNLNFIYIGGLIVLIIRYYFRFTIENHKEHRKFYKEISSQKFPLLICSNHLTMIDSIILQYAFGGYWTYLFRFRIFPWNIPAKEVFAKNIIAKIFLFLVKCIPIDRKGSPEHHQSILDQIKYILSLQEPFIIFPEGRRSRKGTFELENLTYGVGKIIYDVPEVQVLCVYLRGYGQKTFTNLPEKRTKFYLSYKLIKPETNQKKRLAAEKELAFQIGNTIKELEKKYFMKNKIEK